MKNRAFKIVRYLKKPILFLAVTASFFAALIIVDPVRTANAHFCCTADPYNPGFVTHRHCLACRCSDTGAAEGNVIDHHIEGETRMMAHMREAFHLHREWIVRYFLLETYVPALMLMAEQMSSVGLYQMQVVGEIFDAKSNLETQRLFNELQNVAAKDYQPSESFCFIGTNVRSLSHSERIAINNQGSLNQISLTRNLAGMNSATSYPSTTQDKKGRWEQFLTTYCDPQDNNYLGGVTGLVDACGAGATDQARVNIDIDYQRLIDEPRYLNVDYSLDGAGGDTPAMMRQASADEQDVISLANNLYGHNAPNSAMSFLARDTSQETYLQLRSVLAKRAVAENSYNAIVGLKSRGSGGGNSAPFLRSLVADLGMTEPDINEIFGDNPSYYGQLEVLGKKIFQNADFFTDLYDKPANVARKQAALNAIELMLDRAIYESELRNEMLMSVLLSSYLEEEREIDFQALSLAGSN